MLLCISEALETPVGALLGETLEAPNGDSLKAICEKLEVINLQLARRKRVWQNALFWIFISLCVSIEAVFALLIIFNSQYLGWDYNDPETAVAGTLFNAFEWTFVRAAPLAMLASAIGAFLVRKRN